MRKTWLLSQRHDRARHDSGCQLTPKEFVPAPHCTDRRSAIEQLDGGGGNAAATASTASRTAAAPRIDDASHGYILYKICEL